MLPIRVRVGRAEQQGAAAARPQALRPAASSAAPAAARRRPGRGRWSASGRGTSPSATSSSGTGASSRSSSEPSSCVGLPEPIEAQQDREQRQHPDHAGADARQDLGRRRRPRTGTATSASTKKGQAHASCRPAAAGPRREVAADQRAERRHRLSPRTRGRRRRGTVTSPWVASRQRPPAARCAASACSRWRRLAASRPTPGSSSSQSGRGRREQAGEAGAPLLARPRDSAPAGPASGSRSKPASAASSAPAGPPASAAANARFSRHRERALQRHRRGRRSAGGRDAPRDRLATARPPRRAGRRRAAGSPRAAAGGWTCRCRSARAARGPRRRRARTTGLRTPAAAAHAGQLVGGQSAAAVRARRWTGRDRGQAALSRATAIVDDLAVVGQACRARPGGPRRAGS